MMGYGYEFIEESVYLAEHRDVAIAIIRGDFSSAMDHFQRFGLKEGRKATIHLFNEQIYLSVNPDVAAAVGRGEFSSALAHFQQCGLKEGRVASAQQCVRDQARQITLLKGALAQCNADMEAIRKSLTWRLTEPLRKTVTAGLNLFLTLGFLEKSRDKGITELSSSTLISEEIFRLRDSIVETGPASKDVAVHAHVYYPDMANEISEYLKNIPIAFTLYITTDTFEKTQSIRTVFAKIKNIKTLKVIVTANRGRDVFPMVAKLGKKLAKHELVLHIHTKRSPHNQASLGGWRRYLMESLLGNPARVNAIFQQFVNDDRLGILFPCHYHPVKLLVDKPNGSNDENMLRILERAGKRKESINRINRYVFPSGDMFWFRGKAIEQIVQMKLTVEDFDPELGQFDQTLAHALERLFPYFASEMKMRTQSYLADTFHSPECSAHTLDLFIDFQARGLIINPTVLFDHNGGGGTNVYTDEFVKIINLDENSVLRVYPFEDGWVIQWLGKDDGMLFYTSDHEKLFHALEMSNISKIVVNSLYGQPDLAITISSIIDLAQRSKANLEVRIHDFNFLCPSQHLLDFKGQYCGVPQNAAVCENCLKFSNNLYHPWYPEVSKTTDIVKWRAPFKRLLQASHRIVAFDVSSVDILQRGFNLDRTKVEITPHTINYFKCDNPMNLSGTLHIGLLGTMTLVKGSEVVKSLYEHIANRGLNIPITLVGPTIEELPSGINIHGKYTPNDLPIIVGIQAINVILFPSIVPETFSYTISEAMKMKLPIVAFDIGAQGNRVKQYKLGKVVPMGSSSEVILTAIQSVLATAQELNT